MPDPLPRLTEALADRYRIERQLGQGGMATVYLAEDLKHARKVAIKVLRPELAAVIGAERFLREIRTIASLQHPHILALFDSGRTGGQADGRTDDFLFYVMPFVEGESLRDRLNREKQLPIPDAVRIAGEVASALDYAHRHGVIHRDIKPENILLHDGQALVADFGIALAVTAAGGTRLTETGLSLGTPYYMSPEQAMGEREITGRSDVFSLGVVTYEMLLGEPPFTGPTSQAVVARVMNTPPASLVAQRDRIPPHVEEAVLTALEKLPADRWGSAAEFAAALEGGRAGGREGGKTVRVTPLPPTPPPPQRGHTATAALALAAGWWLGHRTGAASGPPPTRLALMAPGLGASGAAALFRHIALTPDGSAVVYVGAAPGQTRGSALWIQRLDQAEPTPIPNSDLLYAPKLSPDGRWVSANRAAGDVVRLPIQGAGAQPAPLARGFSYEAWHPDGSLWITRAPYRTVERVAAGSDSLEVRITGLKRGVYIQQILDDGRHAFVVEGDGASSGPGLVMDLETGRLSPLIEEPITAARYAAGSLVYARPDGTLLTAPFDPRRTRITGEAVIVATGASVTGIADAQFAVARNGTLVYIPEEPRSLVLVDRSGSARPAIGTRGNFHAPSFSPDGHRLALDFVTADGRDVWILDLDQATLSRATFERDGHDPVWSRDGRQLTFSSFRSGVLGIYRIRPGSGEPAESLLASASLVYTGYPLPDGSSLVTVASDLHPGSGQDIGLVANGGRGPITPIVATTYRELFPALSPDGRWVAYVSDQSGESRVYLRPLGREGNEVQISQGTADEPVWGPGGRELFYRASADGRVELVAAHLELAPTVRVTERRTLFALDDYVPSTPHTNYALSPDGRTFVMIQHNPASRIMVIQNLPALASQLREAPGASR
jgi:Tol biopolymer transport system component/tRNA A-37 threonylcarbamoyl transferase component Bud32